MGNKNAQSISRHGCTADLGDWSQTRLVRQIRAESIKQLAVDYLRQHPGDVSITTTMLAKAIGHVTQRVALVIAANRRTFIAWKPHRSDSTTFVQLHPHLVSKVII